MKIIDSRNSPVNPEWLLRPVQDNRSLELSVANILREVRENGDEAVRRFSQMFDKVAPELLAVSSREIDESESQLGEPLKEAILLAKKNIERFHSGQLREEQPVETMPGVKCWRKQVAIEKVGLYIPGGTAPLFSTLLMLGIPAVLAGCKEIVLCSPPGAQGKLDPAILYAAKVVGVTRIFKAGGVQAIAAMAYGTETIPKVSKIFGPGNQYVMCAKQLVQKDGVAIDMPAGPSEVAVYADAAANPVFVAADLLSQAEHGPDSQVLLISDSDTLVNAVLAAIEKQLETLPRKDTARKALDNSKAILVKDEKQAMEWLNEYAPEHLILACAGADKMAGEVVNAGSVFIGAYSPESVGDYASGTNHTLPTNGYAKAYSGVSVDSFLKKITFQQLSAEGIRAIGKAVILMAEAEGLRAHAEAVRVRVDSLK